MKKIQLSDYQLKNLDHSELSTIIGGAPTKDTGFWYDLMWGVGRFIDLAFVSNKCGSSSAMI